MDLDKKLKTYRLSKDEYQSITRLLGRAPEGVEWALFSALWSEHCSYKSSKIHLRKFYSRNSLVVTGPGENAGVIDLDKGERIAFKMESHNHPSFIEPYQGAATGVGGILRDIFTMGARPVAVLDYLCFGDPSSPRMKNLVDGVVRGIGGYGNCVGVPNLNGQTEFDNSYNNNILVNAMAVGLFRPGEPILDAIARGEGNLVVYVGAKTGRDGIHGASMASESFDDKSESMKPTVQKGDPFFEKLLIESCIEVMQKNLVLSIQDMGAAGLTSSSFEMAARGDVGMRLELDKVPLRDTSMKPEDILLSESQERMLLICTPQNFGAVRAVFQKWDLDVETIGTVTNTKKMELYWRGELLTSIDPKLLTDHAPKYDRPHKKWQPKNYFSELRDDGAKLKSETLTGALQNINQTSRKWIYEQYDQHVGGRTVSDASEPVGVIRLPDSHRGLGVVTGCRPTLMRIDAELGARDAISYPALQLASKGFKPLAVTDCLNFGNPENPEIMSEFVVTVEAMSAICKALDVPVISGNVSFYNETLGKNITSTPATGLVGLRPDVNGIPKSQFQQKMSDIFLLRLNMVKYVLKGNSGQFSGQWDNKKICDFVALTQRLALIKSVRSTRTVGLYGLLHTLSKMCLSGLGAEINAPWIQPNVHDLYSVVFEVDADESADFKKAAGSSFQLDRIGMVRGDLLVCNHDLKVSVADLQKAYASGWEKAFGFS